LASNHNPPDLCLLSRIRVIRVSHRCPDSASIFKKSHLLILSFFQAPEKTQCFPLLVFCGFSLKSISLTVFLFPRVAEVLEGKGAGKRGRFQGKATKMSRRAEVQALLQDYISTQSAEE
jgi:hypothetical protein